ncbi:MAG: M48 family metallopeptidase [Gammaproteobacteria bacterium]
MMPLLFVFCAQTKADGLGLPCQRERQTANLALQRIENEWPLRASSDGVSQYIERLGIELARSTVTGREIYWRFSIVRNLAPNAFSIGNGYVFVTEGALKLARNESELAAILAHEIGHEIAGHFCGESRSGLFDNMFDIFSGPKSQEHRIGIGSLTQIIDPVKEREADRIGLSILQFGGFNPRAMLDISLRLPIGMAGHFSDTIRLQALREALAGVPEKVVVDSPEFAKIKHILSDD